MKAATKSPKLAAPARSDFRRGAFSLTFKFSVVIGGMLAALLVVLTLMVNDQLRRDITREVAERGHAVAANLALKAEDPLVRGDELMLAQLIKDSLEKDAPQAQQAQGFLAQLISDLTRNANAPLAKNEGIDRVAILKLATEKEGPRYYNEDSSGASVLGESKADLPRSSQEGLPDEPYPVARVDGRLYYDIVQPVVDSGRTFGEIHLYLRKDIIGDAVRIATARLVLVMLASLLAGLLALWLVVRVLLSPIRHLVRGVSAVARGDFSLQLSIKRGDELGDLVDAYNGMARSLKEKEAVQEALAKYTSKDLVNQMLTDKSKLELGGQRVHATILFSVVRGMHALSQSLPAEEYVALVNEYLEVETEAIMRNGGSIDKFIGDEVMAVWGLSGAASPETRAQNAYMAVKAGVEVQTAIEKLNADRVRRGEQPFLVSIGINNGEVVSGNMGSSVKMDHTVLGGNVNLAARLGLVAAKAGQTIISQSVCDLVAGRFTIDKLAPMPLKGIKDPVPLFWPRKALS